MQPPKPNTVSINGTYWAAPETVKQCPLCLDDAGSVTICEVGDAALCSPCFNSKFNALKKCPTCRKALPERAIAAFTRRAGILLLNNTQFRCTTGGCDWTGGYKSLGEHAESCMSQKMDCDYDCGKELPRGKMEAHRRECRKRPYTEGNLETDFETLSEVKKLKTMCLEAKKTKTKTETSAFLDRLIKVFPLVTDAALKESSPSTLSGSSANATVNISCKYQCGFIANTLRDLASHFSVCPRQPLDCRHCSKSEYRKNLSSHEEGCNLRPISCTHCDMSVQQGSMVQHFESCISYPLTCNLCHNNIARSRLKKHKASECQQRHVDNCMRCFGTIKAVQLGTHKLYCQFMKEIVLPASSTNAAVTLAPQQDAVGPFYQPKYCPNDSSTIYLALPIEQFIRYLASKRTDVSEEPTFPPFESKSRLRCQYAGSKSIVSVGSCDEGWKIEIIQPYDPNVTRRHHHVWTDMEILDAHNQTVAPLMQCVPAADSEGGVKICVNALRPEDADGYLKHQQGSTVRSHRFPSGLALLRFRHDKQKKVETPAMIPPPWQFS